MYPSLFKSAAENFDDCTASGFFKLSLDAIEDDQAGVVSLSLFVYARIKFVLSEYLCVTPIISR